jgi:hypothetical protein
MLLTGTYTSSTHNESTSSLRRLQTSITLHLADKKSAEGDYKAAQEKHITDGESVKNKGNFKFLFCCTLFCFSRDRSPWIDKALVVSIRYTIVIIYLFIQTHRWATSVKQEDPHQVLNLQLSRPHRGYPPPVSTRSIVTRA